MKKTYAGFTLVELLLYISIASVMLLAISAFLSVLLESRIKNQTVAEVEQQGLQVMQRITHVARNASGINTPTQGASATSLSLATYTGVTNPTVFDLSAGTIRVKEGASAVVSLTNSKVTASELTFQNLTRTGTAGAVHVQFTLSYVNTSGNNAYSYTKTFNAGVALRQP